MNKKKYCSDDIIQIKNALLQGQDIRKEDALSLLVQGSQKLSTNISLKSTSTKINENNDFLETLCSAAQEIRHHFCGTYFDICAVINGKSGKCSENCKFCAQSSFYDTTIPQFPLLKEEDIIQHLHTAQKAGLQSCALVNAGKRASKDELKTITNAFYTFTHTQKKSIPASKHLVVQDKILQKNMHVCASLGLLDMHDFQLLKESGVTRIHNNLETSKTYFANVCTSHTFEEKVASIKAAQTCGLMVCSGGIFGLGETLEDRIDMAFTLKELGIVSVPINILSPIKGTPFEKNEPLSHEEVRALVAVYRFILPKAFLRLAGGRTLFKDKGRSLFEGGANAMISGNMLTISGFSVEEDLKMVHELGFNLATHPIKIV